MAALPPLPTTLTDWDNEQAAQQDSSTAASSTPDGGGGSLKARRTSTPGQLNRTPSLTRAASFLRSSFSALRGSIADRHAPPAKHTSHSVSSSAGGGLISTLLHAVGLGSKAEHQPAASGFSITGRGKSTSGTSRPLPRLSSAAFMQHELQHLPSFGDLRNDSFSNASTVRLMKRNSHAGDLCAPTGASPQRIARKSSTGVAVHPIRSSTQGMVVVPPSDPSAITSPSGIATSVGSPHAEHSTSLPRVSGNGTGPRPPTQPRPGSADRLPAVPLPHGTSPSASPMHGRAPVRERPATPRGRSNSSSGCSAANAPGGPGSKLTAVIGSFRLPDILSSGKSVTERRGSMLQVAASGNSTGGSPRADVLLASEASGHYGRRQSATGSPHVRGSGGSFLSGGGALSSPVMGPGGAAIHASAAKRAAALAAASGGGSPMGPAGGLISPVAAAAHGSLGGFGGGSGAAAAAAALAAAQPRPPSQLLARRQSHSGGKPQLGSILTDFQSSLELDEEGAALAAVEAEFDRRFGRQATVVPGAVDYNTPTPQKQQQQPAQQQPQPQPPHNPHPPMAHRPSSGGGALLPQPPPPQSRRTTAADLGSLGHSPTGPSPRVARHTTGAVMTSGPGTAGSGGGAVGGNSSGGAGAYIAPARVLSLGWDDDSDNSSDEEGGRQGGGSKCIGVKNRLASIRMSCADGIMAGIPPGGGGLPPGYATAARSNPGPMGGSGGGAAVSGVQGAGQGHGQGQVVAAVLGSSSSHGPSRTSHSGGGA